MQKPGIENGPAKFAFNNVELYKSESLGSGSYGEVCKAKCDGLLCAAKTIHTRFFNLRDPATASHLHNFEEECHLLSLVRHPNVVQYLGTYNDPDTRLPVLLMELCDENLTSFLERSPRPLSYHVQVNICHDIALALVYLHSNGLIHRNLTGNNILMIAGPRAKVTDFGMSKLTSSEVQDIVMSNTFEIDIVSFGIIVLQIVTRQLTNPSHCIKGNVAPESEWCRVHLKLIPDTHSLKPLAVQCLKKYGSPSASVISERLWRLKQSHVYVESMHLAPSDHEIEQLAVQLECRTKAAKEQQKQIAQLIRAVDDGNREIMSSSRELQEQQHIIQEKDKQRLTMSQELKVKSSQVQEQQFAILTKDKIVNSKRQVLLQTQKQLQTNEQLIAGFQNSLLQKDKKIVDLQHTISAREKEIKELQLAQEDTTKTQHQPVKVLVETSKDTEKMKWRKGGRAPEAMSRGTAVVHKNKAYIRPHGSCKIYKYQNIRGRTIWSQEPENPNINCGLVVIGCILTSVGGKENNCTNTLLSLEESEKQWFEFFPPMPTPRLSASCATTQQALIVAGGWASFDNYLDTVEVMSLISKQWTTVSPLPRKCWALSATVYRDTLYLAGGFSSDYTPSKSVFASSIPDLLQTTTSSSVKGTAWKEIGSLPVVRSTLIIFGGQMLAVGGRDDSNRPTSNFFRYNVHTDSWNVTSQMMTKRSFCLAVSFPQDRIIVVGGHTASTISKTNDVEILE